MARTDLKSHQHIDLLSDREQEILRAIIQSYVLTASPVGSAMLAKQLSHQFKVSSATIRNVMAHLEELGFITHPHTSAGRIPTDKGYRHYVDLLMNIDALSVTEHKTVVENIASANRENVQRDASRLLSALSHCLGVVEIPLVTELFVRKIELLSLSSTRILVIIALDSDVVRTITLEAAFEIDSNQLDEVARLVNERISGKALKYIREHFSAMMQQSANENVLVRLFIDSVEQLFHRTQTVSERVAIAGTQEMIYQPEFDSPDRIRGVIELIQNEDIIIHLLERSQESTSIQNSAAQSVHVAIGSELQSEQLREYSLVSATYNFGNVTCSVGLIGPKRMNYSKMISLVGTVAGTLSSVE